jgi:AbrB family looped-hinge helix DNA binding protein
VDSKGRIVLPKDVRERLDIESGSEVEVRADDGKAVVEPERDPDEIIDRMAELVESAEVDRQTDTGDDVYARDHAETIRRQAREARQNDE